MKKVSLSKRILNYCRARQTWISGGELERLAMEAGFKSSNAGRRCREMESGISSDGRPCEIVLERRMISGTVFYKALPKEIPQCPIFKEIIINGIPIMKQVT